MGCLFRRPEAAGAGAPEAPGRGQMAACRAALMAVAREWSAAGLDPRDPITKALLKPKLEERLAANGTLGVWRAAGIDPYAVLEGAMEAVEAEDPA
ncbi:hypothetical protein [Adlercreutzia caecimuris]|uniref:hypothetical protein n=1 Tax=Adlercreutzia caecimuris TaxID=671266 RepID=UPI001C3E9C09|nr:hypothetical protein [Adlercreutzia caecimuris]